MVLQELAAVNAQLRDQAATAAAANANLESLQERYARLEGDLRQPKQMQSHISRNKVCCIFPHAEVRVTPDELRQDPNEYAWASGITQFLLLSHFLLDRCYWTKVIHEQFAFCSAFCCSTCTPARLLLAQQRLHQPKCYQGPDSQQWLRPEPYAGVYCEQTTVASLLVCLSRFPACL